MKSTYEPTAKAEALSRLLGALREQARTQLREQARIQEVLGWTATPGVLHAQYTTIQAEIAFLESIQAAWQTSAKEFAVWQKAQEIPEDQGWHGLPPKTTWEDIGARAGSNDARVFPKLPKATKTAREDTIEEIDAARHAIEDVQKIAPEQSPTEGGDGTSRAGGGAPQPFLTRERTKVAEKIVEQARKNTEPAP
jgi:hypothetical protein